MIMTRNQNRTQCWCGMSALDIERSIVRYQGCKTGEENAAEQHRHFHRGFYSRIMACPQQGCSAKSMQRYGGSFWVHPSDLCCFLPNSVIFKLKPHTNSSKTLRWPVWKCQTALIVRIVLLFVFGLGSEVASLFSRGPSIFCGAP